jgi:regulator of sigma E protease
MSYVLMVLVLGALILIHELGHLLAAKAASIPIERFSVGFGPRLLGIRWKGTDYWMSLIPVGGYVLPRNEEGDEFMRISVCRRVLFCLGGPAANLVAALLSLAALQAAGSDLSLLSVLVKPFADLYAVVEQIVAAIPTLFQHPDRMSGIVGIVALGGQLAGSDLSRLLAFSVFLNVNLAIFNLLPLPPLDGGKIAFYMMESVWRPLKCVEVPVTITGWILMLGLMLYATVVDVGRLMG